ncbi:hypothetical protein QEZ54_07225 [Catellatospora sp. KI3]|uniref:hypothetical protein n=1 Tax=Catellatospora sp. KI3 TaxID=3041620 RepID=UPI002482A4D7|nr:hypothetical protein [Catellatospora sp. KI3]MDI1460751.1 hypothetical protein [Catellatospora sp. KI3]
MARDRIRRGPGRTSGHRKTAVIVTAVLLPCMTSVGVEAIRQVAPIVRVVVGSENGCGPA